jgi:magnesium transporter
VNIADVRARLHDDPDLLARGPSAVLYAVTDVVVDGYLDAVALMEDDIAEIETVVFEDTGHNHAARVYRVKREVLELRRAVGPLVQPLRTLAERADHLVDPTVRTYFRDVGDHLDKVHELLRTDDEILNSILEANLAQLSVRQNEDMRKITSWAAIIAVPTAIAGIYGMNFRNMPELHWAAGYPLALLTMAASCVLLYWNFKRRGWL